MSKDIEKRGKKKPGYFTQIRKICFVDVLVFCIMRHAETLNQEISSFFTALDRGRCTRQAMFKAMLKVDPEVFRVILQAYAVRYYTHKRVTIYKLENFIVITVDGSHMDLPYTKELVKKYGGQLNKYITDIDDVQKPQARVSMLFDPLNKVVLDAWIQPLKVSESVMLYEHLRACESLLKGKQVILLGDRNYGSAELFLYCKKMNYAFIMRGKSSSYKKQVAQIKEDGNIVLRFTPAWIRRMKHPELAELARTLGSLTIRTVKSHYFYTNCDGKKCIVNGIYFVSESLAQLSRQEIIDTYHLRRWDVETGYFDLKNWLQAERFNSTKDDIITCELYAKFICLSLVGSAFNSTQELIDRKIAQESPAVRKKSHKKAAAESSATAIPVPDDANNAPESPVEMEQTCAAAGDNSASSDSGVDSSPQSNNTSDSPEHDSAQSCATETTAAPTVVPDPYDRIPNMKNICDSLRGSNRIICYLTGNYNPNDPISFPEYIDRFIDDCSLERISVRPNRHVKRWGRYIEKLPHYKFRVDGRRNPFIEPCRNGARGYVTRQ